jgi:hypothetical protein
LRDLVSGSSIVRLQASLFVALGIAAAPLVTAACSGARYTTEPGAPTLVLPAHVAEGKAEPGAASAGPVPEAPPGAAASGSATPVAPALTPSTAPDPAPLRQAEQVEYELELSEGKVRVVSVKAVTLPAPVVTPRRLGRYAIELSIGPELIERLRFDFPGTAADEPQVGPKKPLFAPLTLSERAIARVKLQVPQSPRVRRALLIDRALNTATALEWPLPVVPKAAAPSSAASAKAPPVPVGSVSAKLPAPAQP